MITHTKLSKVLFISFVSCKEIYMKIIAVYIANVKSEESNDSLGETKMSFKLRKENINCAKRMQIGVF